MEHVNKHTHRPWHLIPEAERFVVDCILRWSHRYPDECRAAADALQSLAPYPDEALVFGTGECSLDPVVHLVGVGWTDDDGRRHPRTLVCEDEEGTEAPYHPSELQPLTIAAAEMLEMIR